MKKTGKIRRLYGPSVMAIYAMQQVPQPPDSRTYSAEVTSFRSNLPHHRRLRPFKRPFIIQQIPRSVNCFLKRNGGAKSPYPAPPLPCPWSESQEREIQGLFSRFLHWMTPRATHSWIWSKSWPKSSSASYCFCICRMRSRFSKNSSVVLLMVPPGGRPRS